MASEGSAAKSSHQNNNSGSKSKKGITHNPRGRPPKRFKLLNDHKVEEVKLPFEIQHLNNQDSES